MGIGRDLKITISAADNASKGLRVVQGAAAAMAAETRKAATDMNKLGLSYKAPTRETKKLDNAITRLRARMAKIRPVALKMFRGFKSRASAVISSVFSMRAAFIGLAGAASLGLLAKSLITTASAFEDLRTQLDALQGSSKAGQEAVDWIKTFAKETPLSMEGVTRAFVMARAFGLDPMDGTMQSLVDINSKLGGKMEKLIFITRGVGQMFTKGRISAQEMNLQLTEQGVPAWELLAKAMNRANNTTQFTTASLQKMSERGELGKDAIKLLIEEMGRFGKGAAAANMDKFSGLMSNFGDEVSKAKDEFARADRGLLAFIKSGLTLGIKKLNEFRESGALKKWGQGVGDTMLNAAKTVLIGAKSIRDALAPIFTVAASGINSVIEIFNLLPAWMKPIGLIGAILLGPTQGAILIGAIGLLRPIIDGVKQVVRTFKGELGDAFDPKPVEEMRLSLIEIASEDGALGSIARVLSDVERAFERVNAKKTTQPGPSGGIKRGVLTNTSVADDDITERLAKLQADEDLIALTQRNIRAELDVESAAQRLAADQAFKAVEFENESLHLDRLMEINALAAQSQLDLSQETRNRLAEMSTEDAALEINRLQASVEAVRQSEISKSRIRIQANQQNLLGAVQIGAAIVGASKASAKANFLITKAAGIASILINTQAAAQLAMSTILPPANFAVAAKIEAQGFRRAGIAAAVGLTQSIGVGGGSGGGGGGGQFAPQQGPQDVQSGGRGDVKVEVNINAFDPSSVSQETLASIGEIVGTSIADHVGAGGATGVFQLEVSRS